MKSLLTILFAVILFFSTQKGLYAFWGDGLFSPKEAKETKKKKESLAERTLKKAREEKRQKDLEDQLTKTPKEKEEGFSELDKKAIEQLRTIAKEWIVMANQKYPEVVRTRDGFMKHYTVYPLQCDVEIKKTHRDDEPYLGFVIIPNTYYKTRARPTETEAWQDSLFTVHNRINRVLFEYKQDWTFSPVEQRLVFNQKWEFKKVQYREEGASLGSPNP